MPSHGVFQFRMPTTSIAMWNISSTKMAVAACMRRPSRACGASSMRTGCIIGVASSGSMKPPPPVRKRTMPRPGLGTIHPSCVSFLGTGQANFGVES